MGATMGGEMQKYILPLAACALALGAPLSARAWGPVGHSAIGKVAYMRVSDKTRKTIDWIIKYGVPALNAQMDGHCQIDPAAPFKTLDVMDDAHTDLANWADCNRYQDSTTADWHFDDIPLKVSAAEVKEGHVWCKDDGCVSKALEDNLKILAQTPTDPAKAARALAYVIHFMGDLHQPLHTVDNGDRGGNGVKIHKDKKDPPDISLGSGKLHSLWDTPLVLDALDSDLGSAVDDLNAAAASEPAYAPASVDQVVGDSYRWVATAHGLAITAYATVSPPVAPLNPPLKDNAGNTTAAVSADYVDKQSKVVRAQLADAAVRLAGALNTSLSWAPPKFR